MIVIQTLMLDGNPNIDVIQTLVPSVDFLKIDGASVSVNEKLKASIGSVNLAASMHATANNYFKNVDSVLAKWP